MRLDIFFPNGPACFLLAAGVLPAEKFLCSQRDFKSNGFVNSSSFARSAINSLFIYRTTITLVKSENSWAYELGVQSFCDNRGWRYFLFCCFTQLGGNSHAAVQRCRKAGKRHFLEPYKCTSRTGRHLKVTKSIRSL